MKKTYMSPAFIMVRLNPSNAILITSMGLDATQTLDNSSEILSKEYNSVSDVNVWDEEW